jgi:hypothetical protein
MAMRSMHKANRHAGRMGQDSSLRPTNKAEVGIGMAGMIVPLILLGMIISWIIDL